MENCSQNKKGLLCVISSPSGGGKSSVIRTILNHYPEYRYSISATTRKKRAREAHGVDYYFISNEEFDNYIEQDEFIEWAEVHTDRYGTLKKPIKKMLENGDVVLLDVDVIGGMNVSRLFPECSLLIFLKPPSLEELERRLFGRKSENMDQIQKRLERLPKEMSYADKYNYQIVNRDFKETVNQVENLIEKTLKDLEVEVR